MLVTFLAAESLRAAIGTIGEPLAHRNLQIFPIHSDTQLEDRQYVTLSEAMAKGMVVVRETGTVNELSIENVSKDRTIFLNAGDIVKGGRQDRTIRDDLILTSRSGVVPLSSFCVEHGRWTRRGDESAAAFSMNSKVLSSRKLKMASRYGLSQSDVWAGVAEQQSKLNDNVSRLAGKSVETRSSASVSSLQLTLENQELDKVKKGYLKALESIMDGKTDVVGFVYAINGEINSAEVYNNKALFQALWPKLLDAAVTEAVAEFKSGRESLPVQSADLKAFFETAVSGSVQERSVWKTTRVKTYTASGTVLFETLDVDADNRWIHKSFINKGSERIIVPLDRESGLSQPRLQQRSIR
jgi:hypothetical protein